MAKLKREDREGALIDMKKMLNKGKSSHEIHQFIRDNYQMSKQNIVFLFQQAKENARREIDFNIRDIMIKNTSRYEKLYWKNVRNPFSKKLDNPDEDLEDEDARKTLFKIAGHYMTAIKALNQKEKMLGIVHNRMDVQLKNELAANDSETLDKEISPTALDISKLSMEEKKEFLYLLDKSKGKFDEVETKVTTTVAITSNQNDVEVAKYEEVVDKFEVEDIDHEEVIEDSVLHPKRINDGIIREETERLEAKFKAQKDAEAAVKLSANKKKLLELYKKSKK